MSFYRNLSDNALYDLLIQDSEEAFTELYRRYWKRMLYKARLKLQTESDAEEVVQDTFVDIWKSRHRIQLRYTFHTYIASIVKYKIMAKMAAYKNRLYDNVEEIDELQIRDNSTQEWLSFYDLRAEIELAIKALPEKCQLVFRMSREAGMSDKQIAENLEISQKTVEAHISRALKALRASINQFLSLLSLLITFFVGL